VTFSSSDRATSIAPDEQGDLIPDLSNQQELNEWERENILVAVRWALDSRSFSLRDPLGESYVRELHRRMFDQTWKWAGMYRATEKNIGVAPHQIRDELAKLLADVRYWMSNKSYAIDEIGARLHHKLVSIHPFPNGNGRHSRLMTDVVLKHRGVAPFTWGSADLTASGDVRERYIAALRAADAGDLTPLLAFVRT
jgi:Fic-DOC domain mobile mystery protein B